MDPLTLAGLLIGLAQALVLAFAKFGPDVWGKKVEEVIPATLRVRLEKIAADAAALQKFKLEVPESPFDEDAPE